MDIFTGITFDELAISGALLVINTLILLFFYYKLQINSKKNNNFFNLFKGFVLFFGIFTAITSILTIAFPREHSITGQGYIIGHFFLYIACAYLVRIWLLVSKPLLNSVNIFRIYVILGLIATLSNLYLFNYSLSGKDATISSWMGPFMFITIIIMITSSLIPAAFIFIREAIYQPKLRKRYLLIGISLIIVIIGGPLHNFKSYYLLADLITAAGFVLLFWGVMSNVRTMANSKSIGGKK